VVSATDPDKGTVTTTYNPSGDVDSVTDGRNTTLYFEYDRLGRQTKVREGLPTGDVRSELVYDTLAKGTLTSATRYVNEHPYTSAVTGYNDQYQPTGTSITLPAAEGALAGTYTSAATYHLDGSIATRTTPAMGGLPEETFTYGYTPEGLPNTLSSDLTTYVASTIYSPFAEPTKITLGVAPKRVTVNYMYLSGNRRLDNIRTTRVGGLGDVDKLTYTYDPAGNVSKVVETGSGQTTDSQCFG
jgi:hypothetical protein